VIEVCHKSALKIACSAHRRSASLTGRNVRLLLIEDEVRLVQLLNAALARANFAVDAVGTSADGRAALAAALYDALILDLGLPDSDGLALLRAIRASGNQVPILILTARDAVEDRVCGLDSGADDYLVKPFATVELIARIKALLRRPGGALGTILQAGNVASTRSDAMSPSGQRASSCRGARALRSSS
jgi:DNA-binding response OmpR family regulator